MKQQILKDGLQSKTKIEKLNVHKVKQVNVTFIEDEQEILDLQSIQIDNQNSKQLNKITLQLKKKNNNNENDENSRKQEELQIKDSKDNYQFSHQKYQGEHVNLAQTNEIDKNKVERQSISKNSSMQKSRQKKQNFPIKIDYQQLYQNLKLNQSNEFSQFGSPKQSQFDIMDKKINKQSRNGSIELNPTQNQLIIKDQNTQNQNQIIENQIIQNSSPPQNQSKQNFQLNQEILQQPFQKQNKFDFQTFKKLHPILKELQTQLKNLKFPSKPSFSVQNIPHNQKIRSSSFIISSKDNLLPNKLLYKRQRPVKIYSSSKNGKLDQKRPYHILKTIKSYLQLIATGNLDSLSNIQIQQINKQKMLKVGLFYERVCIIVAAYGYLKLVDQRGYLKINDMEQLSMVNQLTKFMINMISFALNNNSVIQKIIQKHLINQLQQRQSSRQQSNQIQTAKFGQDDPNKIKSSKTDRIIMKRNYDALRSNNEFILQTFSKITYQDQSFTQNFKNICKCISKFSIQETFYNLLDYFSFYLSITGNQHQIPFLAVAPNPYLPPLETHDKKYTLVIDFIEVFCHGTKKSKNHIFRPYSQHFLAQMSRYFNIVSFSSALPNQIDTIIDILDHKKIIKHRLYKHHMIEQEQGIFVKDLSRIGRNLKNLILLDVVQNEISKNNTFCIDLWKGSKNDSILAQLCPLLASIAIQNIQCEQALNLIKQQRQRNLKNGIHYLNFGINFGSLSLINQN